MADTMSSDGITSAEGRLLAVQMDALRDASAKQMDALRDDVREVKSTMREMARSLEQLVRIEEQQKDMRSALGRAFEEIDKERGKRDAVEKRVAAIEHVMPGLRELRGWVIAGVISGVGMIAGSIVFYFFQNHVR